MNAKRWTIAAVAAVVFVAGSLFFGGGFLSGEGASAWRIRFPNGVVHELLPHLKGGNSLGGWRRVAVEPFPIYVEFPVSGLEFRFERERIYLNGRLYGIVMRNYDDLERNKEKLGQVRFLMCYGRLGDERTFEYLRRMESLRAVSILSPMPADLEALARYRPEIEVLDLNCAYWPCEFSLSRFEKLAVLSVRGKYWRRMYDGEEVSVRRLYLGEGKPSDLPERRSGLEVLEISVSGAEELGELWKVAGEMPSLRVLYVKASYVPGEDFCEGIPGGVEELSVILDSGLYWRDEARRFVERTAAERGGLLFHTNVFPSEGYDGDVPFPVFSYLGGKLVSVTSDAARLEKMLMVIPPKQYFGGVAVPFYENSCFLRRVLDTDSFTLRTEYSGFESGLRAAVVQKKIKYLKIHGALDVESARLICEKFPFLEGIFLPDEQGGEVVSALLKGLPEDCAVNAAMNEKEYAGRFSAKQLERLRVFLCVKEEVPASLTEAEAVRIVGVWCNTDRESLSRLKMFRNLKYLWVELTTLDIGDFPPEGLVLDEFRLRKEKYTYTEEDPRRKNKAWSWDDALERYLKREHEVVKRLCNVEAKRISTREYDGCYYKTFPGSPLYEREKESPAIPDAALSWEWEFLNDPCCSGALKRMKPYRQLLISGGFCKFARATLTWDWRLGKENHNYYEVSYPFIFRRTGRVKGERAPRFFFSLEEDNSGQSSVIFRCTDSRDRWDEDWKPIGIDCYLYSKIHNYCWPGPYEGGPYEDRLSNDRFDMPRDYYWEYFEKAHLGGNVRAFRF